MSSVSGKYVIFHGKKCLIREGDRPFASGVATGGNALRFCKKPAMNLPVIAVYHPTSVGLDGSFLNVRYADSPGLLRGSRSQLYERDYITIKHFKYFSVSSAISANTCGDSSKDSSRLINISTKSISLLLIASMLWANSSCVNT